MEKKTPSAFRKVFNLLGKNKASFATALLLCSATEPLYQIGFTFSYKYIVNGIEFKNVSMLINSATALIAIVVIYNIIQPITAYYYEREVYKPTISVERNLLRSCLLYTSVRYLFKCLIQHGRYHAQDRSIRDGIANKIAATQVKNG